jgi:hypothetical protein
MAANDAGFSAPNVHGQPPSLPPPIIAMANNMIARNSREFREEPPPLHSNDAVGVNDAPSSAAGDGGVRSGPGDAPGVSQQGARKRRVVVCKKCGGEGHMAKTCTGAAANSASDPQPAPQRARGGGAARPPGGVGEQPYEDEEGEDVLAEDADDVYVEIGCYKFQEGDFTWERIDVPHAVAEEVQRDLRSGQHSYGGRDLPKFKLGPARCKHMKARTTKAWDFLDLLLDETLISMLVENTNKYARSSAYKDSFRGKAWRDVDTDEMKLYLAIVIFMGVVRVPSRQHVFDPSSLFGQEWVFSKMSRHRFDSISRCLHSDAPGDLSSQERERRNKYHFKMFSWNCAETGYCFCFYWYRGKEEQRPASVPATLWPVMKLTAKVIAAQPRILRNNFVLTTDNWYTSLHEGIFLAKHGIHCCGTLRTNRVTAALPPQGALFKKTGAPPRGTMVSHELKSRLLPPNRHMYLTAWVDNKPLHVLHSWPTRQDVCERNHKQPGAQEYRKKQFSRPTVCKSYNKTMGGTDLADLFLAAYATNHRTRRWQPRILFHCIQIAVVNAHILYCHQKSLPHGSFRLLDFIVLLLQEISPKPAPPSQVASYSTDFVLSSRNRKWWNVQVRRRTEGQHFPDKFTQPRPSQADEKRESLFRKCIYCKDKQVQTFCKQCGVYLCLGRCFHEWHTLHDLNDKPENVADDACSSGSGSDSP